MRFCTCSICCSWLLAADCWGRNCSAPAGCAGRFLVLARLPRRCFLAQRQTYSASAHLEFPGYGPFQTGGCKPSIGFARTRPSPASFSPSARITWNAPGGLSQLSRAGRTQQSGGRPPKERLSRHPKCPAWRRCGWSRCRRSRMGALRGAGFPAPARTIWSRLAGAGATGSLGSRLSLSERLAQGLPRRRIQVTMPELAVVIPTFNRDRERAARRRRGILRPRRHRLRADLRGRRFPRRHWPRRCSSYLAPTPACAWCTVSIAAASLRPFVEA